MIKTYVRKLSYIRAEQFLIETYQEKPWAEYIEEYDTDYYIKGSDPILLWNGVYIMFDEKDRPKGIIAEDFLNNSYDVL